MRNEGKDTTKTYLEDLRFNNKEYFGYIKSLLPLLDYTQEYNDMGFLSVLDLFSIIRTLFYHASDVDTLIIDCVTYRDNARLNKALKKQQTLALLSPDMRFNKCIKTLKQVFQKLSPEERKIDFLVEHLMAELGELVTIDAIEDERHHLETKQSEQKQLICRIYENSPFLPFIKMALDSISIQEKEPEHCFSRVLPLKLELENPNSIIDSKRITACYYNNDCSLLLVNRFPVSNTVSPFYMDIIISIPNPDKRKFEPHRYFCSQIEFVKWYQQNDKDYNPHLIIHHSLFNKIKIANHHNIFIYCDKPYEDVRKTVIDLLSSQKSTIIEFENVALNALIIEVEEKQYYILPFVSVLTYNVIKNDIRYYGDQSLLLTIDEKLMNDVDYIVNSIYNVQLE